MVCPFTSKVLEFIYETKPVEEKYIKHANICKDCYFIWSYELAIVKTFGWLNTITRYKYANCPPLTNFLVFFKVLSTRYHCRWSDPDWITEENDELKDELLKMQSHIKACNLCTNLAEKFSKYLKVHELDYRMCIDRKETLMPPRIESINTNEILVENSKFLN